MIGGSKKNLSGDGRLVVGVSVDRWSVGRWLFVTGQWVDGGPVSGLVVVGCRKPVAGCWWSVYTKSISQKLKRNYPES